MLTENAVTQGNLWGWRPADWAECMEPGLSPLYEAVLDDCGVKAGAVLLDAGCGTGGATLAALRRGAVVTAFDASEGFLGFARTRVPTSVDLRVGDLQAIPFADDQFDHAIAVNSVQFSAEPVTALRELGRVSKGKVGIVIWSRSEACDMRHISEAMAALFPKKPAGRGPFELAEPGELEALLTQAGMTVQSNREVELVQIQTDLATAVRGIMSTGPNHRAAQILGEERVSSAVRQVLAERFQRKDGSTAMTNYFRIVAAKRS